MLCPNLQICIFLSLFAILMVKLSVKYKYTDYGTVFVAFSGFKRIFEN